MEAPAPAAPNPKVLVLGSPNSGKSALFNLLTGATRRVGNYAGVTQAAAQGQVGGRGGAVLDLVDTPGIYRLFGDHDEQKTAREMLLAGDGPDLLVVTLCAEQMGAQLPLLFDLQRLRLPMLAVVTMDDLHAGQGLTVDLGALAAELGCEVVSSSTVRPGGVRELRRRLFALCEGQAPDEEARQALRARLDEGDGLIATTPVAAAADALADRAVRRLPHLGPRVSLLDRLLLHPLGGALTIFLSLAVAFQLVFEVSGPPADWVAGLFDAAAAAVPASWQQHLPGRFLAQGLLPGLGAVMTLLPPILAVSFLMLLLEQSGVLSRIALLCDDLLRRLGMGGYGLFPMLSGLSCALPAIAAARAIPSPGARMVCMAAIPLVPCSARLPVYALVITAFIPHGGPWGFLSYKGLALLFVYVLGLASALVAAGVAGRFLRPQVPQIPIEMPGGKGLRVQLLALGEGLWLRGLSYVLRAGPFILLAAIALWALAAIPAPFGTQEGGGELRNSMVGLLGTLLHPLVAPLGFSWELSVALIPGLWAREVVVGALASIYALQDDGGGEVLAQLLSARWSFAQGMSLAVWYVYAPQCLATFTFMHTESGSGRFAWTVAGIYLVVAWIAAFLTYNLLSLF